MLDHFSVFFFNFFTMNDYVSYCSYCRQTSWASIIRRSTGNWRLIVKETTRVSMGQTKRIKSLTIATATYTFFEEKLENVSRRCEWHEIDSPCNCFYYTYTNILRVAMFPTGFMKNRVAHAPKVKLPARDRINPTRGVIELLSCNLRSIQCDDFMYVYMRLCLYTYLYLCIYV